MAATRINPGLLSQLSLDPTARLAAQAFGQIMPSMKQARQEEREKKEAIASANAYGQLVQNLPKNTPPNQSLLEMLSPKALNEFTKTSSDFKKLGDAENIIITRNGVIIDGPVAFQPRGDGQYVNARGQTVEEVYGPGVKWQVEKTPGVKIQNYGKDGEEKYYKKEFETKAAAADVAFVSDQLSAENYDALETTLLSTRDALDLVTENPTIFGASAAVNVPLAKFGIGLMNALGVSEGDSARRKLENTSIGADEARRLTMNFVRERFEATKGAISDKEFQEFLASVPNLLMEDDGYKIVVTKLRNLTAAKLAMINEARSIASDFGPDSEETARKRYSEAKKLFGRSRKTFQFFDGFDVQNMSPEQTQLITKILSDNISLDDDKINRDFWNDRISYVATKTDGATAILSYKELKDIWLDGRNRGKTKLSFKNWTRQKFSKDNLKIIAKQQGN
tara:strand:+ start:13 stop:1365 length:1353 start_codon:yes stop_codon:yes gene_type:complete